jgi:precorrin-2 dehydrogenase/sirohydrochlorin ferrochelatase
MERNELYPVFLKLNNLNDCRWRKCRIREIKLLLKSSPNANVEVVAPRFLRVGVSSKTPFSNLTAKKIQSLDATQTPYGNCLHR